MPRPNRLIIVTLFCLLLVMMPQPAWGETSAEADNSGIAQQYDQLDWNNLTSFLKQVDRDLQSQLSGFSLSNILQSIRNGKVDLNLSSLFRSLLDCLFRELRTHAVLLGKLMVMGAFLAMLEHLQGAFEENTVARLAHGVGVLALLTVAISSFTVAVAAGRGAIEQMVGLMQAILPILMTLMAAIGGVTTVTLLNPVLLVATGLLGTLVKDIVFPLIYCAALLSIVNQLSERIQISRLAGLFKDGGVMLLGLFLTIFVGVLSIQGVAGAVTDGVGLRTAKFLTGAFVPVVGGILSDAVETVVGCSLFIKNAVGIVGALTLLFICVLPVIKILAAALVYRLSAALMQPLGADQLGESLQMLGGYLFLIFGAVAAVGLIFLVSLTMVVALSNFMVMLR